MTNILALLLAGAVLAAASTAFAGEPTGRYQGAEGHAPATVDQVATGNVARGGYVTAAAGEQIIAGQDVGATEFALRNTGRGGNVASATLPGNVETAIQIALAHRQAQVELASRQ